MNAFSQQNIIEGNDLKVVCNATAGNPIATEFFWTMIGNPGFKHEGPTLQLSDILRTNAGTYKCTAENNYSDGKKGADSQSMDVNVLCM